MPISRDTLETTFKELGIPVTTDGESWIHASEGRYAPAIHAVVTLDEDGAGATMMVALPGRVPAEKRPAVCELLNQVHGQSLWNVRFHLDEAGRVFSIGKFLLWGRPFNATQFGDIFYSLLVSTDRLHPSLSALVEGNQNVAEAFEKFFLKRVEEAPDETPDEGGNA